MSYSLDTGDFSTAVGFRNVRARSGRLYTRDDGRGEAVVLIQKLQRGLEAQGVYVGSASWSGLAEEAGGAYKNIDDVVDTTEHAGISKRVVRFVLIGNIKG